MHVGLDNGVGDSQKREMLKTVLRWHKELDGSTVKRSSESFCEGVEGCVSRGQAP